MRENISEEMIGKELGAYTLLAKVGHGLLGSVYQARHQDGQRYALKLIHPQLLNNPQLSNILTNDWQKITVASDESALTYRFRLEPFFENGSLGDFIAQLNANNITKMRQERSAFPLHASLALIYELVAQRWNNNNGQSTHGGLHPNNIMLTLGETERNESLCDAPIGLINLALVDHNHAALTNRIIDAPAEAVATSRSIFYWERYCRPPLLLRQQLGQASFNLAQHIKRPDYSDMYALGILLFQLVYNHHPQLPIHAPVAEPTGEMIAAHLEELASSIFAAGAEVDKPLCSLIASMVCGVEVDEKGKLLVESVVQSNQQMASLKLYKPMTWPTIAEGLRRLIPGEESNLCLPICLPLLDSGGSDLELDEADEPFSEGQADDLIYIIIELPEAGNGTAHLESLYPQSYQLEPEQESLIIGSAPFCDIVLPYHHGIEPHELTVERHRQQLRVRYSPGRAQAAPRGERTLNGNPLRAYETAIWQANEPLVVDAFRLHWRQSSDAQSRPFSAELLPQKSFVKPGYEEKVGISIRNSGNDGYFLVKLTKGYEWLSLVHNGVLIKQGQKREVRLRVKPKVEVEPKTYPYTLAISRFDKNQAFETDQLLRGAIVVEPQEAAPQIVKRQTIEPGIFELTLQNLSGSPEIYNISAEQNGAKLKFALVSTSPLEHENRDELKNGVTYQSALQEFSRFQRLRMRLPLVGRDLQSSLTPRRLPSLHEIRRVQRVQSRFTSFLPASLRERLDESETAVSEGVNYTQPPNKAFLTKLHNVVTLPPQTSERIFLWVLPRKRPFRHTAPTIIPFTLAITPPKRRPVVRKELTLETKSRLPRLQWLLLLTLLSTLCLLLTIGAAYWLNGLLTPPQDSRVPAILIIPNEDDDGDGLTNQMERDYYNTDPNNPDSDGDGIPDGLEARIEGLDPNKKDSDDDGIPDYVEFPIATITPEGFDAAFLITPAAPATVTPQPTLTPTPTPTATPVFSSTQQPVFATPEAVQEQLLSFRLGDSANNEPLTAVLQFTTNELPTNATITDVHLVLVLAGGSPRLESLPLKPLYATITDLPFSELTTEGRRAVEKFEVNAVSNNILIGKLPADKFRPGETYQIQLGFLPGSNLDNRADLISIARGDSQNQGPAIYFDYRFELSEGGQP